MTIYRAESLLKCLKFSSCVVWFITIFAVAITFVGDKVYEPELVAKANQKKQVCKIVAYINERGKTVRSVGTGTVISNSSGKVGILTAAHVIDGAHKVSVEFLINGAKIEINDSRFIKFPKYKDYGSIDPQSLKTDFALVFCKLPEGIQPIPLQKLDMSNIVKKAAKGFFATFVGYGDFGVLSPDGTVKMENSPRQKRFMGCPISLAPQTKLEIYANVINESFSKDLARQLRKSANSINSDEKTFFKAYKLLSEKGIKINFNNSHIPNAIILQIPPYKSRAMLPNMSGFTNPGDSGGALFNGESNQIIGVCVAGRPGSGTKYHFTRYQSFFNSCENFNAFDWITENCDKYGYNP